MNYNDMYKIQAEAAAYVIIETLIIIVCIFLTGNIFKKSNTKELQSLKNEITELTTTAINNMNEQLSLYDNLNILTEENVSLGLENERLQEENELLREEIARLTIATDTMQKKLETTSLNNYSLISMTEDERDLLAKILALEACNEPDVGQRAVVEVVFNRIKTGWASTVKNVIYQKDQFRTVKYLSHPYATPTDREYANIDYVLEHGSTVLPSDYVFFATYKANGKDFIQIQGHYFGRQ